ncbi:biogenesis of lysosome-related organelles complex 1 subunit 1 [Lepeophtheirus salmonis]|uniref:Biogenesis of lysosome-related organelles complex 1 subunit 1 n=1 Tax=Lepeophtheirus salmonis TaxID=72036 RepID=C1BSV3_LEPSM|nr:biogenesis of lysosome-related organelles complex 1 subunit 1-like [Lepeophtheirus salmonis]ACO12106.1 Biogenesis of lysosome-related organelles complex-1 subunit 1 [Lepeophtheirus salmonis]ADD38169.1 Biogenesis of lysosome-related organelles complex 1 subunit 1 [Lepeophtheirus salmonis]
MLSSMVKEHQTNKSKRKETEEILRKEASEAGGALTESLTDHLNVGVAQAYINQKRIDSQAKELHAHAEEFAKRSKEWINIIQGFQSSLKDLGDVLSWAQTIQSDMNILSSSLEYVYKVNRES